MGTINDDNEIRSKQSQNLQTACEDIKARCLHFEPSIDTALRTMMNHGELLLLAQGVSEIADSRFGKEWRNGNSTTD